MLDPALRKMLEKRIVEARDAAEGAAQAAIRVLAVHEKEAYASLSDDERRLRRALRAKARQLKTEADVDEYLDDLRARIMACVSEGTPVVL